MLEAFRYKKNIKIMKIHSIKNKTTHLDTSIWVKVDSDGLCHMNVSVML